MLVILGAQSFEAVYQHYLDLFYGEDINEEVQASVKSLLDEFSGICNEADLEAFRSTASSTMTKTKLAQIQSEFVEYPTKHINFGTNSFLKIFYPTCHCTCLFDTGTGTCVWLD